MMKSFEDMIPATEFKNLLLVGYRKLMVVVHGTAKNLKYGASFPVLFERSVSSHASRKT